MSTFDRGERLGPYRIEHPLGEGATGVVYLARREPEDERVALKVLDPALSGSDVYRRRFLREARVAGEVRHPNLVSVLDAGEVDGRFFVASTYVEGGTLGERLERETRLALSDAATLTAEIAAGLEALHDRGIVHRDVKPDNVLLGAHGAALTDFGLAKGESYTVLTKAGEVMGTIDYLAPELIAGRAASGASDIYALGCLVYEMLTGEAPFAGHSVFQVIMAHMEEAPRDPSDVCADVPPEIGRIVLLALAKEPAQRPPTAAEFASTLRSAVS